MIELHYEEESWQIEESDESYRFQELMGDDNVTLVFSLPYWQEFQVGTWIEFLGSKYTLAQPPTFTKNSERNYKYTLIFESEACKLQNFKMRDVVQGDMRLKFSLCAKPHEFIDAIVTNLNNRDSGWERGECIEGTEKTIAFSHNTLAEALQMVADEFETEWEIKNKTIYLRKVEYCKDDPLKLSYGRGNGFISGVGRDNQDEGKPIEILYVQGGEQNINRSKYGWQYLLLPKGQTIEYEGRTYIASEDGLSMKRADKEVKYGNEDSLDCEEIYPKRVGTVSSVKEVDGKDSEGNAEKWYNITDKDNTIDYNQYIIEGETGTLIFQSGMLASREFEWQYNHEEKTITENGVTYTLPAHTFRLVNFEEDGITFPSGNYIPKEGDTYAIFNIYLPQEYIDSAEQEMFLEGAKYLYEHESFAFTFIGVLQGKWAKDNWSTGQRVSTHLAIGSYVHFFDSQFAPEGTDLRIISIKQYLYDPYSPTVEISNESSGSSFSSELKKLANEEVLRDDADKQLMRYSKRRFRDAKETMQMIEQALLKNFTESISPITVQTMSMLVGDESLQFRFVSVNTDDDGKVTSDPIIDFLFFITWDNKTQTLQSSKASILQHMTVGITAVSNSHAANEYYFWNIAEFESVQLTEGDKKYYLYAQCPIPATDKQGYVTDKGVLMLSETAIEEKGVEGYYHFLVGILNSEYDGERSYVSLYGYSEVLPGRITTDLIQDSEGNLVIDLLNKNITVNGAATIQGNIVVSGKDDTKQSTTDLDSVDGGLVANMFLIKKTDGTIVGGLNGIDDTHAMWVGGTYAEMTANPDNMPFYISKDSDGIGSKFGPLKVDNKNTIKVESSDNLIYLSNNKISSFVDVPYSWSKGAGSIYTKEMHDTHNGEFFPGGNTIYIYSFPYNTYNLTDKGFNFYMKVYSKSDGIGEQFAIHITGYIKDTLGNTYNFSVTGDYKDGSEKYKYMALYYGSVAGTVVPIVSSTTQHTSTTFQGSSVSYNVYFSSAWYYAKGDYRSKVWANLILETYGVSGVEISQKAKQIIIGSDGLCLYNPNGVQLLAKNTGTTLDIRCIGLPGTTTGLSNGQLYTENGYLKVYSTVSSTAAAVSNDADEITDSEEVDDSTTDPTE